MTSLRSFTRMITTRIARGARPHARPISGYRHNRTGEDNADAHFMRRPDPARDESAWSQSRLARLRLRSWEQIFVWRKFDGSRLQARDVDRDRQRRITEKSRALPLLRGRSPERPVATPAGASIGMSRRVFELEIGFPLMRPTLIIRLALIAASPLCSPRGVHRANNFSRSPR